MDVPEDGPEPSEAELAARERREAARGAQAQAWEEYRAMRSRARILHNEVRHERRRLRRGRRASRRERHDERRERHAERVAFRRGDLVRNRGGRRKVGLGHVRTLRASVRVFLSTRWLVPGALFVGLASLHPRTRAAAARMTQWLARKQRKLLCEAFGIKVAECYVPDRPPRWSDDAIRRDLRWLRRAPFRVLVGLFPLWLLVHGGTGTVLALLGKHWMDFGDTWPDVLYGFEVFAFLTASPLGLRHSYAEVSAALLSPPENARLQERVQRLTESRADAVDAQAAELRRIERDLHDGVQARLVAMGLNLGAVEQLMERDPEAARTLLAQSREASATALRELRGLVRGIHPPVLAERGLADAIRALALDSPMSVEVAVDLPGRAEAAVESAVYFAVSELLANAARHAHAERVWIDVHHTGDALRVQVTDDGVGGAAAGAPGAVSGAGAGSAPDPGSAPGAASTPGSGSAPASGPASGPAGSGLRGIERRLGTFDGVLAVSSPRGGPTIITLELPCALSSPRTSTSSGKG